MNKLKENPRMKNCSIENDLIQTEAKIRKEIKKIARNEREKGNSTKTGYQKLCINGQWWTWDKQNEKLVKKAKN